MEMNRYNNFLITLSIFNSVLVRFYLFHSIRISIFSFYRSIIITSLSRNYLI